MRILVTGSRTWADEQSVRDALGDVVRAYGPDHTIVHGACPRGADAMADRVAADLGLVVERHPADWDRHGRSAGLLRNAAMVRAGADVCYAFIRDRSRGATHCARLAERAGIRTFVWRDDDV